MMLALNEIRRGKGRFASIIAALSLIVFLVLTLGALSDGLYYGATGAVRTTTADAYAFSSDAKGSLVRSTLPASAVESFAARPGVEQASPVGVLLGSGTGPRGALDLAVFGVDPGGVGVPATLAEGRLPATSSEAVVDSRLLDQGVAVGSTVTVGGIPVTVVGVSKDSAYQLQPTVWTAVDTWRQMRDALRPETRGSGETISAVALRLASGVDPSTVAAGVPGTSALTAEQTGLAIPGVEQQKSTLNSIVYTTLFVAAIVVALFFALIVLEKRELFAALKALGTSTSKLGLGVVVQALVSSAAGVLIGAIASRLLGAVIPATIPTLFRTETLLSTAAFALVAGVVGALFSLRRIARIDPATALGGTL